MDQETRTDRMQAAGLDENGIALSRRDRVDLLRNRSLHDRAFEGLARHPFAQAHVKFCPRLRIRDEPHFRFRLAAELLCDGGGRVHLDREIVRRIEYLNEQRETVGKRQTPAEDFLPAVSPQLVQRHPGKRSAGNHRLRVLHVHDFPCLAESNIRRRQRASVDDLHRAPSPEAFHVERIESDYFHGGNVSQQGGVGELFGVPI